MGRRQRIFSFPLRCLLLVVVNTLAHVVVLMLQCVDAWFVLLSGVVLLDGSLNRILVL